MFDFLSRTLRRSAPNIQNSSCFRENVSLVLVRGLSSSSNKISKAADQQKQHSFTVSYLVNRCGLPLKTATSASQMVHLNPQKGRLGPGLSEKPWILRYPDRQTHHEAPQNPNIWFRSVEKRFVPCYDFIKSMVLSEDKVVTTLKRAPRMLMCDMQTSIAPNIASLRKFGVTQSTVLFLVTDYPNILLRTSAKFEQHVREVVDMGFDPKKSEFVHALRVFAGMSELSREPKMAILGGLVGRKRRFCRS
ncbi:hypothetical protein CK203_063340 [Vitis vinifera]|uniref:Uncharacterized protein n=1 Tax=Vitis vinifera TaxID=29760 RepID=A0A438FPD3_VITVI|nr:hypothetical protein CK203_063340 [Vitis vinifera]